MIKEALAFDIGGTKTAWGVVSPEGIITHHKQVSTPEKPGELYTLVEEISDKHPQLPIGIAIAGTVQGKAVGVCTNLPGISGMHWDAMDRLMVVDNDARSALLAESALGAAADFQNAILLTLGTGIGGGIKRKGQVLPHPKEVSEELSRLIIDRGDVFPAATGTGTLEAILGGRNLEQRFQISLAEEARSARSGNEEAQEVWMIISHYFHEALRVLASHYQPDVVILGGIGSQDADLYLGDQRPPCAVVPAQFGAHAPLVGIGLAAMNLLPKPAQSENLLDRLRSHMIHI